MAKQYNGYCVKCREKRDFDGQVEETASGRRMAKGTCPVCGTKMNRILGKND
jgi:transcription initiation factor IIE alpha subunit